MSGREIEPRRETQPESSYVRASQYVADAPALAAYSQAQELIFSNECDLSAYRIRFKNIPHAVVLGGVPPLEIDNCLAQILGAGEPATLPQDIIKTLDERRRQARRLGPWVEGHYRPGIQG